MSLVWQKSPYKGQHLLLHLALADFANDEGYCFPSIRTLGMKARCSEQWVRKGIRQMIDDDLLEIVEQGLGRGNVNRYLLKGVTEKRESEFRISEKGATQSPQIPNSEHSDTYLKNHHESSNESSLSAFETFWEAYPRKVGKGTARKAFDRLMARKNAPSLHDLLAGIVRYEASITDPRFIAHPTTWLNGERWLDVIESKAEAKPTIMNVRPSIQQAQSQGAAHRLVGGSEEELLTQIQHLDQEHQQAALEMFRYRPDRRNS